jgi:hypothetical protein
VASQSCWHAATGTARVGSREFQTTGRSLALSIGLVGFEPTASTSRTWRSSQAEPQPVKKKRRLDRPDGEVNRRFLQSRRSRAIYHRNPRNLCNLRILSSVFVSSVSLW